MIPVEISARALCLAFSGDVEAVVTSKIYIFLQKTHIICLGFHFHHWGTFLRHCQATSPMSRPASNVAHLALWVFIGIGGSKLQIRRVDFATMDSQPPAESEHANLTFLD